MMRVENADQVTVAPDGRPREEQPRWRREFPIDWPQDDYRSRRDFTKLLGLTSFAFVVGQVWIVLLSYLRHGDGEPPAVAIAGVDEVPVGGSKLFDYPTAGSACILVRTAANEFVAFDQRCTHLSCPVIAKPAAGRLHCPCHNGWFDLRSGEPLAGPPRRPLPRVELELRDGRVFATGIARGIV
jgi:nitrite reductase/ring-hydroxylating ferredoxin subunit